LEQLSLVVAVVELLSGWGWLLLDGLEVLLLDGLEVLFEGGVLLFELLCVGVHLL
jgi:hypothetical protein